MRPSQGHGDSGDQKHAPYPDTGPESRGVGRGDCSAGACPQLGEGRGAQTTPEPFDQPMHPILIPRCAGTSRHERLIRKCAYAAFERAVEPLHSAISSCRPLNSSFPRKRETGFTFEVQHLVPECLSGSIVAEAFARGIVVSLHQLSKPIVCQGGQVGLAGRVRRKRPMAFSMPPFCQGEWVSQKKVWKPRACSW